VEASTRIEIAFWSMKSLKCARISFFRLSVSVIDVASMDKIKSQLPEQETIHFISFFSFSLVMILFRSVEFRCWKARQILN